jgi:hypothetical protein
MVIYAVVAMPPAAANFASEANAFCDYSNDISGCFADSTIHNWDWDLGPRFATVTFDSLYNTYDTTDLQIAQSGTTNDGVHNQDVDIYYHFGTVANGNWALASCQSPVNTSHHCNHWHVIYDNEELVAVNDNDVFFKKVACHETGHTVGLQHPDVQDHGWEHTDARFGCMRRGEILQPLLGDHGANHIDSYYPF